MSLNSLLRTKMALVAIAVCLSFVGKTAQAGNAFMDQIEATRTANETAFATQWCSDPLFVKQIAAAPFKYVGKHVCLQGYVGQPYAESEFILHDAWPPGNQSYEYQQSPPIVIKADARDLSQFQYVEIYGTVVKPEPLKNAEGGSTLFSVVKASIVDENFLGMGHRPKGSTISPSSSLAPPSTSRFADAKRLGSLSAGSNVQFRVVNSWLDRSATAYFYHDTLEIDGGVAGATINASMFELPVVLKGGLTSTVPAMRTAAPNFQRFDPTTNSQKLVPTVDPTQDLGALGTVSVAANATAKVTVTFRVLGTPEDPKGTSDARGVVLRAST